MFQESHAYCTWKKRRKEDIGCRKEKIEERKERRLEEQLTESI